MRGQSIIDSSRSPIPNVTAIRVSSSVITLLSNNTIRDSSVDIVMTLRAGLDNLGLVVRIPSAVKVPFLLRNVQTPSGAHLSLLSNNIIRDSSVDIVMTLRAGLDN